MDENQVADILNKIDETDPNLIPQELLHDWDNMRVNEAGDAFLQSDWDAFIKKHGNTLRHLSTDYVAEEKPMQPVAKQIRDYADNIDFLDQNPTYKAGLAKRFGISVEELDKELNSIIKAKEYQAGRKRRAEEIKEAGFFSPWTLASEYSKQRYIDNPDASIFGKEGNFNPLSSEGQNELRDVILGGAGAVGDLLPGLGGVLVGPAIRSARDIEHKVNDSPYQKEWGDIGTDAMSDVGINAGVEYLPTAILNRGAKMFKNAKGSLGKGMAQAMTDAGKYNEALSNRKAIEDAYEFFTKSSNVSDKEAARTINALPEGPFKQELQTAYDELGSAGVRNVLMRYEDKIIGRPFAPNTLFDESGNLKTDYLRNIRQGSTPEIGKQLYQEALYKDLGKGTKALAGTARFAKTAGGPLVKESSTLGGARDGKPKESENKKHERWQKGFATWDELKTDEYQTWLDANLKGLAK